MSPEHNLQFYTSMSVFMLFPLSEIFSCFHQSSVLHKSQNVTTFCEAFKSFLSPSLSHSMEKASMASITLCQCIYYTLFYVSTSVFLPLNQPSEGRSWVAFFIFIPQCLPQGLLPEEESLNLPITKVWIARLLISRWRNEMMFLLSNVSWEFIAATQNKQKANTHSLKAVRAVLW